MHHVSGTPSFYWSHHENIYLYESSVRPQPCMIICSSDTWIVLLLKSLSEILLSVFYNVWTNYQPTYARRHASDNYTCCSLGKTSSQSFLTHSTWGGLPKYSWEKKAFTHSTHQFLYNVCRRCACLSKWMMLHQIPFKIITSISDELLPNRDTIGIYKQTRK